MSSYTSRYWSEPKDVFAAKADMKSLGLSVADLRKYRSEKANAQQQIQSNARTLSQKEQARIQLEQECRFYHAVTDQDVQRFEQIYAKSLEKIAQKTAADKPLKKQEQQLLQMHEQLKEDLVKTQRCQALEKAAAL